MTLSYLSYTHHDHHEQIVNMNISKYVFDYEPFRRNPFHYYHHDSHHKTYDEGYEQDYQGLMKTL